MAHVPLVFGASVHFEALPVVLVRKTVVPSPVRIETPFDMFLHSAVTRVSVFDNVSVPDAVTRFSVTNAPLGRPIMIAFVVAHTTVLFDADSRFVVVSVAVIGNEPIPADLDRAQIVPDIVVDFVVLSDVEAHNFVAAGYYYSCSLPVFPGSEAPGVSPRLVLPTLSFVC